MDYSIWIVSPPGYLHSHAFDEIALSLKNGFAELGFKVPIVRDAQEISGKAIVLGCNLLPHHKGALPRNLILFNLEQIQVGSPWLSPAYLELLKRYPVWDYSYHNMKVLQTLGVDTVTYCGIGYSPVLSRISQAMEDIDILFYGSINSRRLKILQELKRRGVEVVGIFGVYGEERDRYIARSKVIVNIHYYEARVFEMVRVSYLLANKKFVISEVGHDQEIEKPFAKGMIFSLYHHLVEICMAYLKKEDQRREIAEQGFNLIRMHPQSSCLKKVLGGDEGLHGNQSKINSHTQVGAYYAE